MLEDNGLEAADFFLGTAAANVVRVPLYRRNSREAHGHMLRNTGCRMIVVSEEYAHEVAGLEQEIPTLERIVVRRGGYESWLATFDDRDPDPAVALDDYYVIRFSGGTTGTPKGMAFSHRAWMNTERDWTYLLPPIVAGDACTHAGPISHGSGYLYVPLWLAGGYSILEAKFNATRILDLLDGHGGYFFAVPTMLATCWPRRASPARVSEAQGGGRLRRPHSRAHRARRVRAPRPAPASTVRPDRCVPATWLSPNEWFSPVEGSEPLASVGRVMPFAEVEIRDDDNRPLPVGEIGEIALRADGQMLRIWKSRSDAERVIAAGC